MRHRTRTLWQKKPVHRSGGRPPCQPLFFLESLHGHPLFQRRELDNSKPYFGSICVRIHSIRRQPRLLHAGHSRPRATRAATAVACSPGLWPAMALDQRLHHQPALAAFPLTTAFILLLSALFHWDLATQEKQAQDLQSHTEDTDIRAAAMNIYYIDKVLTKCHRYWCSQARGSY